MALNYIWIAFFFIAFVIGLFQWLFLGDHTVFPRLTEATFSMAKTGFEISIWLTGVLSLWLGIMKIGEKGGMIRLLSRVTSPLFSRLFPDVPKDHPAMGAMLMNISANMLGLDNAATPLGLKAMNSLQEINPNKDTASNAQIMFLVLNTSGLTLIPVSVMVYRSQMGAADPSDIFIPILLATFFSTMAGLLAVSFFQKVKIWNRTVMSYLLGITVVIAAIITFFSSLSQEAVNTISSTAGNFILFSIIVAFIALGVRSKINVYESFVEGAKEGFGYAVMIIPYLIAILVAVGVFRESGALNFITDGIRYLVAFMGMDTAFVDALPTAFMKPLSGGAARGMMIETMDSFGADSFAGRLASVFQGSTETTFYVLAVYFGSVNIKKTRHALTCGLIADLAGIIAAIFISYLFFAS